MSKQIPYAWNEQFPSLLALFIVQTLFPHKS
jgi:hypothetical protein